MNLCGKQEPLFELIESMSKAEKRNFKLYATRLAGNQQAKFVQLFDAIDSASEYDEARILAKCPIKKEQLPNMKAHLYKQILISIRLLDVQHTLSMQLREQVDFARILYDKGLYRQSVKLLEKAKEAALENEQHTIAIDIIEFQKKIEMLNISRGMGTKAESVSRQAMELCEQINNINNLSNISMQLYALYLKLGYARSQKDMDMIKAIFKPKLDRYHGKKLTFVERFHYLQSNVWYSYILHDLLGSYKYACRWIDLFDANPHMKVQMYDSYLRGYSRLLDGLFLLRSHKRFSQRLEKLENEFDTLSEINDNARIITMRIIYINRINRHFSEGTFAQGVLMAKDIEFYIRQYRTQLDIYHCVLLYYKVACLYFGNGDYAKCMDVLSRIISTRDPQVRRDLQCYARILYLICSYESGVDYNIDYQIKSVYSFLVKMNDMHLVQREMLSFLKRIGTIYEENLRDELKKLYDKLKPYEEHPYERRTFYYLDILSWLESKINNISVADVIRNKYLKEKH